MAQFGIDNYLLFLSTGILLNLTPGPDTMYIIGRSLSQGKKAGISSSLGISAGGLVHTLLAALGLSAILATSATAFLLLKTAGALYLIWLGLRLLLARTAAHDPASVPEPQAAVERHWIIFRQGVLTNVLNPKVALFFLAFLPQFIDPEAPSKVLAFLLLGLTFVTTGTIWCLMVAWSAGTVSRLLRRRGLTGNLLRRLEGVVFLCLGLRIALSTR